MTDYADHLSNWIDEVAAISNGRICADKLRTAVIDALAEGLDLDDPKVRRSLIEAAAPDPTPAF